MEKSIYIRNMDGTFNKKRLIENTIKVNIYYQQYKEKKYKEKTEIDVISGQKWSVILKIL